MIDPKQVIRTSKAELDLIAITFKDYKVLYTLRNLFFQFDITDEEKKLLNFSPEVFSLLKKMFLPTLSPDYPLHLQLSLYQPLNQLRQMNFEPSMLHIKSNDLFIAYIKQQFQELVTGVEDRMIILENLPKETKDDELRFLNMLAFQAIISYIDGLITAFRDTANPPPEPSPEETKKREQKNSTQ